MGLQLLLVDVERGATLPRPAPGATSATGLRTLFADVLLPRLDPDDVAFLTAVAPLEQLEYTFARRDRPPRLRGS